MEAVAWGGSVAAVLATGGLLVWVWCQKTTHRGLWAWALAARLVSVGAVLWVTQHWFRGRADYVQFHHVGAAVARGFAEGGLAGASAAMPSIHVGTQVLVGWSALLAPVLRESLFAMAMATTALAAAGAMLLAGAGSAALPPAAARRYALLLAFCPSVLFWTSSLGKETLLFFGFGLFAAALVPPFKAQKAAAGMAGLSVLALVRPQVAAVALVAAWGAALVAAPRRQRRYWAMAGVATAVVVAVGLRALLGLWPTPSALAGYVEELQAVTGSYPRRSGHEGLARPALALAGLNTLLRPTLWEARTVPMVAAALESTLLAGTLLVGVRRIWAYARVWGRHRIFVFHALFFMLYATLLGNVLLNMGILVRQRVLMYPALLWFVAVALAQPPSPPPPLSSPPP